MQYTRHHSFSSLLQTNAMLSDFVTKLEKLTQIQQLVTSKLTPDLQANCCVANLRDGKLILSTTSPTWNHKLRFCSLDLLSALRAEPNWAGLKSIEIRVDYLPQNANDTTPSPKKLKPLSKKAAAIIEETAHRISHDKLAAALIKLAKK